MKNIITILGVLLAGGCTLVAADSVTESKSDPYVMKIYPDGTKVIVRWSEIGKSVDNGERFGGAPRIVAYDPTKDGVVPIGTPQGSGAKASPSPEAIPASTSVVDPNQPAKMDYKDANPDDYQSEFGPYEGFAFRTAVGVSYQQSLSGRSGDGQTYNSIVFQPGIRYDLEANYNVTDWFRVGVETAFIYNEMHSVTSNGAKYIVGGSTIGNGGYYQVPVLLNMVFTFPSDGPLRGYFGGATGATWDILQYSASGDAPYTSYQWNYAWQATAGFTYAVAPGLDLDIAYKMLSNPSPNFRNEGAFKASYNHSAEVGLVWRF